MIESADLEAVIDLLAVGFWRAPHSYWEGVIDRVAMYHTPEGVPKYGYLLQTMTRWRVADDLHDPRGRWRNHRSVQSNQATMSTRSFAPRYG
jgi:hypothetical protein